MRHACVEGGGWEGGGGLFAFASQTAECASLVFDCFFSGCHLPVNSRLVTPSVFLTPLPSHLLGVPLERRTRTRTKLRNRTPPPPLPSNCGRVPGQSTSCFALSLHPRCHVRTTRHEVRTTWVVCRLSEGRRRAPTRRSSRRAARTRIAGQTKPTKAVLISEGRWWPLHETSSDGLRLLWTEATRSLRSVTCPLSTPMPWMGRRCLCEWQRTSPGTRGCGAAEAAGERQEYSARDPNTWGQPELPLGASKDSVFGGAREVRSPHLRPPSFAC